MSGRNRAGLDFISLIAGIGLFFWACSHLLLNPKGVEKDRLKSEQRMRPAREFLGTEEKYKATHPDYQPSIISSEEN